MAKQVLIIGAGIGGLATAVRLLSRGYKVKIFEKEPLIGGKIQPLAAGGYHFDLTASILMTPSLYQELFTWVNRDYRDYLEFIKLNPNYRVFYEDGSQLDFSSDLADLSATLESLSKEDAMGFVRFLADFYEKYHIADENFFQKPFRNAADLLNASTIASALKLNPLSTPYDLALNYIKDERLLKFICFQAMYIGISPFEGPGIYNLIPAVTALYGLWHLKGGLYSYIKAMKRLINEFGGAITTNAPVEEILISHGKAVGIKTCGRVEYGDIVICNADFPYAVKSLIRDIKYRGKYTDEKLEDLEYSCSNFILYLGLNKEYPELKVHNHYLGRNFKENTDSAFKGRLPEEPPLYFYYPCSVDETMAPKSRSSLSILARVPNLLFNQIVWDQCTINMMRERIFSILQSIRGLENIKQHIEYESCLTPADLKDKFNSYGGTSYGLSPTLLQTNYFRPHIKSEDVENLYFVGSSVHPGSGASIVLIGSKLVAEDIINNDPNFK